VNNMPDGALEATERQFLGLLEAVATDRRVRVRFYSLPEVPRSEWGLHRLENTYSDIEDLWTAKVDAVIVTGTEPRAPELSDEPYWTTLTTLIDWAERNTSATVWSCLAAHAAVLHIDNIRRRPLPTKCSGVFACTKAADHFLLHDLPGQLMVPHSRGNGLNEDELHACGYRVLSRSSEIGVDAFITMRNSLFLCFQGHPEYEADTLLREYRRDVGRYLRGERDNYPEMPAGYFDSQNVTALSRFRERAHHERAETLLEEFPAVSVDLARAQSWHRAAARIYRTLLGYVVTKRKDRRPVSSGPRPAPIARPSKALHSS
jgi:homoserine O-succinyltransferase/O-acetyltransferase